MSSNSGQFGHPDNRWDDPPRPPSEHPNHSTAPLSNQQLRDVITKTLEQSARKEAIESGLPASQQVIIDVVKRHPHQTEHVEIAAATELVQALGQLALPSPIFRRTIEQRSPEIAAQILADPIAFRHLNQAWLVARRAARLSAE